MKESLVIIDPQVDFCDPSGNLYVGGAENDIARLATLLLTAGTRFSDINVTLDSHHTVDIAHPVWWKDSKGNHPGPFTLISATDVRNGVWIPTQPALYKRSLAYVETLEKNGRYVLCVWPVHCRIGSKGATVMPDLFSALCTWEDGFKVVNYKSKGSNPFTEHYSAVVADVPDPQDPTTQLDMGFVQKLMDFDRVYIAGEARSHCLANTVRDVANAFGDDSYVKKLWLIEDGTSDVGGFESMGQQFLNDMLARGMNVCKTSDLM